MCQCPTVPRLLPYMSMPPLYPGSSLIYMALRISAPPLCANAPTVPRLLPYVPMPPLYIPRLLPYVPMPLYTVPRLLLYAPTVPRLLLAFMPYVPNVSSLLSCLLYPSSSSTLVPFPSLCGSIYLLNNKHSISYLAVSGGLGAQILNLWPLLPPTQGPLGLPALHLVHSLPQQTPTTR